MLIEFHVWYCILGFSLNIDDNNKGRTRNLSKGSSEKLSFSLFSEHRLVNGFWEIFQKAEIPWLDFSPLVAVPLAFWFYSCVYILCHESGFGSLISFSQMPNCKCFPSCPSLPTLALVMTVLQYIQAAFSLGCRKYMAGSSRSFLSLREVWAVVSSFSLFLGWGPGHFRGWSSCFNLIKSPSIPSL